MCGIVGVYRYKNLWQLLVLEMWNRVFMDRESLQEMESAESQMAV